MPLLQVLLQVLLYSGCRWALAGLALDAGGALGASEWAVGSCGRACLTFSCWYGGHVLVDTV